MSISPPDKQESFETPVAEKIRQTAKATVAGFFTDPVHYLFYSSLAGIIVGLFFNAEFPPALYFIVGVLGLLELLIKEFYAKRELK